MQSTLTTLKKKLDTTTSFPIRTGLWALVLGAALFVGLLAVLKLALFLIQRVDCESSETKSGCVGEYMFNREAYDESYALHEYFRDEEEG